MQPWNPFWREIESKKKRGTTDGRREGKRGTSGGRERGKRGSNEGGRDGLAAPENSRCRGPRPTMSGLQRLVTGGGGGGDDSDLRDMYRISTLPPRAQSGVEGMKGDKKRMLFEYEK